MNLCFPNFPVLHCQDPFAHSGAPEGGALSAGCALQECTKRKSSCSAAKVQDLKRKDVLCLELRDDWKSEMFNPPYYILTKWSGLHCVSVSSTVRTAPLPSVPAGYMDICMSTRWQEISILLLESTYTFVHEHDHNDALIIDIEHNN